MRTTAIVGTALVLGTRLTLQNHLTATRDATAVSGGSVRNARPITLRQGSERRLVGGTAPESREERLLVETERTAGEEQFKELLQEIRVAIPGTQILLAFLLTVPFDQRFELLSDLDKAVFVIAILSATAAAILLIAPTAQHRLTWRTGVQDWQRLLETAGREILGGLVLLGVATVASVFVVIDLIYEIPFAALAAAAIALLTLWLWLIQPLRTRPHGSRP
jgi:hypothetical protein